MSIKFFICPNTPIKVRTVANRPYPRIFADTIDFLLENVPQTVNLSEASRSAARHVVYFSSQTLIS